MQTDHAAVIRIPTWCWEYQADRATEKELVDIERMKVNFSGLARCCGMRSRSSFLLVRVNKSAWKLPELVELLPVRCLFRFSSPHRVSRPSRNYKAPLPLSPMILLHSTLYLIISPLCPPPRTGRSLTRDPSMFWIWRLKLCLRFSPIPCLCCQGEGHPGRAAIGKCSS